jgi:hypothetical protein
MDHGLIDWTIPKTLTTLQLPEPPPGEFRAWQGCLERVTCDCPHVRLMSPLGSKLSVALGGRSYGAYKDEPRNGAKFETIRPGYRDHDRNRYHLVRFHDKWIPSIAELEQFPLILKEVYQVLVQTHGLVELPIHPTVAQYLVEQGVPCPVGWNETYAAKLDELEAKTAERHNKWVQRKQDPEYQRRLQQRQAHRHRIINRLGYVPTPQEMKRLLKADPPPELPPVREQVRRLLEDDPF